MGGGGPAQARRPPASGSRLPPVCGYRVGLPLVPCRGVRACHSLPRSLGGGVHYCPLQFVVWQSSTQCLGPSCTPLQLAWARRVSSDTARRCPLS